MSRLNRSKSLRNNKDMNGSNYGYNIRLRIHLLKNSMLRHSLMQAKMKQIMQKQKQNTAVSLIK